jgi:hypothetical protein
MAKKLLHFSTKTQASTLANFVGSVVVKYVQDLMFVLAIYVNAQVFFSQDYFFGLRYHVHFGCFITTALHMVQE